jgi:hypothetical protein
MKELCGATDDSLKNSSGRKLGEMVLETSKRED